MFRLTLCLLLLSGLSRLAAAEPESLSLNISAGWQALQARTKTLSPEERIAAVDEWQKAERPLLETLRQARHQSSARQPAPVSRPALVTELEKIDAAIWKEFQPIWNAELTPEESIRQVDAAIKKTAVWQADRARLIREEANAKTPETTPTSADPKTPEGRLANKSRELLGQTEEMSPEERIAVIDRMKPGLDILIREVHLSNKQSTDPSTKPSATPNSSAR